MAWIQRVAAPHECAMPRDVVLKGVGRGSVWECETSGCKKRWVYTGHVDGLFTEQENVG